VSEYDLDSSVLWNPWPVRAVRPWGGGDNLTGVIFVILVIMELHYCYSDSLWSGRSGDRILVGGRFSAPIQTVPGAHPSSYTMGTGSFPGVKVPGRGVDHPPYLAPRL
jgi:hypothetical protein